MKQPKKKYVSGGPIHDKKMSDKKRRAKKNPSKYNTTDKSVLKAISKDLEAQPKEYTAAQLARFNKVQNNGGSLIPSLDYINPDFGHGFQPLEAHITAQGKIDRMKGSPNKKKAAQVNLDREVAIYKQQMGNKARVADYMMNPGLEDEFAYGGRISSRNGNDTVRHYIETPDEAMRENDMAKARAYEDAASNPWTQGLDMLGNMAVQYGTSMMTSGAGGGVPAGGKAALGGNIQAGGGDGGQFGQGFGNWMGNNSGAMASELSMLPMLAQMMGPSFAMGGQVQGGVPVEIEGQELIETPDGQVAEAKGPSHENGGIDIVLPEGTEVYSKRLKGPDGKSYAKRKEAREKKVAKLTKLFDKAPKDKALAKALERTKATNAKQDASDKKAMQFAQQLEQMKNQMATGGTVGNPPYFDFSFLQNMGVPQQTGTSDDYHGANPYKTSPTTDDGGFEPLSTPGKARHSMATPGINPEAKTPGTMEGETTNKTGGLQVTGGDALSLAGTIMAMNNSKKHARKMAANKIENKDFHKDYGNAGLDTLDKTKGYVEQQRASAMKSLEDARTGASRKARSSARGVNQLRGLDLANQIGANRQGAEISDNFSKQMMSILGQEAGMKNQQDQVRMGSAKQKHLEDQQDRGAELSAMAQAGADQATGMQHLGKNVNQLYENRATGNAMNKISANYQADPQTGRVTFKDQASVDANPEFKGLDPNTAGVLADATNSGAITFNPESNTWTMGNKQYTREELITQMGNE